MTTVNTIKVANRDNSAYLGGPLRGNSLKNQHVMGIRAVLQLNPEL
jgi:hypothetical protein